MSATIPMSVGILVSNGVGVCGRIYRNNLNSFIFAEITNMVPATFGLACRFKSYSPFTPTMLRFIKNCITTLNRTLMPMIMSILCPCRRSSMRIGINRTRSGFYQFAYRTSLFFLTFGLTGFVECGYPIVPMVIQIYGKRTILKCRFFYSILAILDGNANKFCWNIIFLLFRSFCAENISKMRVIATVRNRTNKRND